MSLFAFAVLPGIFAFCDGYGPLMRLSLGSSLYVILAVGAFRSVWLLRNPKWFISLGATLSGGLLGLALTTSACSPTHTWLGDTFMHGRTTRVERFNPSPINDQRASDLAYLQKGAEAADKGQALKAPEGGYLAPVRIEQGVGALTDLRFVSVPMTAQLPEQWHRELQSQTRLDPVDTDLDSFVHLAPAADSRKWLAFSVVLAILVNAVGYWRKK